MDRKNKSQVINDSDKNLGAVIADKTDVITECKSQLYDIKMYTKLSLEEMEMLIAKIWKSLVETNLQFVFCKRKRLSLKKGC